MKKLKSIIALLQESQSDIMTIIIMSALLGIGLMAVNSSSSFLAGERYGDPNYFFYRQLIYAFIGLVAFLIFMNIDYRQLRYLVHPGLLLCLLFLVLTHYFGVKSHGSSRWLKIGFVTFQPSELAKLNLVLYFAYYLTKHRHKMHKFKATVLPLLGLIVFYLFLFIKEPDFGGTVIVSFILMTMLYLAGAQMKYLALLSLFLLSLFVFMVKQEPYRLARLVSFLCPEKFAQGIGYNLLQSKVAISCGGLFGRGIGQSLAKNGFLPEVFTDHILAVIFEELGLIGGFTVALLFLLFFIQGMTIALRANDYFGSLIACGVTLLIAGQAFINIGVVLGLLPTKGLCLPFISYGGTSLVTNLIATGILISVSRNKSPKSKVRG